MTSGFFGIRAVVDSKNAHNWGLFILSNLLGASQTIYLATVREMGTKWREALVSTRAKISASPLASPCTRQEMSEIRLPCNGDVGQSWADPQKTRNRSQGMIQSLWLQATESVEPIWPQLHLASSCLTYMHAGTCSISRSHTLFREDTVFSRNPDSMSTQLLYKVLS